MVFKGHKLPKDDEDEKQDWVHYLDQNLKQHTVHETPFPASSWAYSRAASSFYERNGLKRPDMSLHEEILRKLYLCVDVDASKIIVDVFNGHVSLTGEVNSLAAKQKASEVIENIDGIWKLINDLTISSTN